MSGCPKAALINGGGQNMTQKNKDAHYGQKVAVQEENGIIDYDPEGMKDIVGGEKLSYDEYLEIQKQSQGKVRGWFQLCYYEISLGFKGQIERKTQNRVCFKRIFVEGMYSDGLCIDGKEDHVWMDLEGFEQFKIGDSVSFSAEVYRYLKTGNGKLIDFGLRNPTEITIIDPYELPSDDDLMRQSVEEIVCETCLFTDKCYGICLLPKGEKKKRVDDMLLFLKHTEKEKRQHKGEA